MKNPLFSLFFVILSLFVVQQVVAQTCYIAPPPVGNDNNGGLSPGDPFATLQRTNLAGCTVVLAAAGTYSGVNNTFIQYSTSIHIAGRENGVIFDLTNFGVQFVRAAGFVIIEGVTITSGYRTNAGEAIIRSTIGSNTVTIRRCQILNMTSDIDYGTNNPNSISPMIRTPTAANLAGVLLENTVLSNWTFSFTGGDEVTLRGFIINNQHMLNMSGCTVSNMRVRYVTSSPPITLDIQGFLFQFENGFIDDNVFIDYNFFNSLTIAQIPIFRGDLFTNIPSLGISGSSIHFNTIKFRRNQFINIRGTDYSISVLNSRWVDIGSPQDFFNPSIVTLLDNNFSSGVSGAVRLQVGTTITGTNENSILIGGNNTICSSPSDAAFFGGANGGPASFANFTEGNTTFQCISGSLAEWSSFQGDFTGCTGCQVIANVNADGDEACESCDCNDANAALQTESVCGTCSGNTLLETDVSVSAFDICDNCGTVEPVDCIGCDGIPLSPPLEPNCSTTVCILHFI